MAKLESEGKLGTNMPRETIRLFQRALVQWGCEVASPARNPLRTSKDGESGIDGIYSKHFRNGVRRFQRAEGLPPNGSVDAPTVKRIALRLHTNNTRREVESEQSKAEAEVNLEAERTASATSTGREDTVQRVLWILHHEGDKFIGVRRPTSPALAAFLVASRISGFDPETINEALERILLVEPEFYHQILFEGKLIAALQDFGIHGLGIVVDNVPQGADFPVGFAIEARDIAARTSYSTPTFSGTDVPLIAAGFVLGAGRGLAKAVADNLSAILGLVDPEFWVNLGNIIGDSEFRYAMGRGAAEALRKKIAGVLASGPYDYGMELGTLFGMLLFEFTVTVLLAGGTLPLKLVGTTDELKGATRLQAAARKIAKSAAVRKGINISRHAVGAAVKTLESGADLLRRARRLLPDITQHAKASRAVDEVAALELAIQRKIDAFERGSEKLALLSQKSDPDPDRLQALSREVDYDQRELTELLDAYGSARYDDIVARGRGINDGRNLPPEVLDAEIRVVKDSTPTEISRTIGTRHYDLEIGLKNGHHYRHDRDRRVWCRHSDEFNVYCPILDNSDFPPAEWIKDFKGHEDLPQYDRWIGPEGPDRYNSATEMPFPKGHIYGDKQIIHKDYKGYKTTILDPSTGIRGEIIRSYYENYEGKRMLVMNNASLDSSLQWSDVDLPLVPGRGTPTVAYATLRQMQMLKIKYGDLEMVRLANIENAETAAQLRRAQLNTWAGGAKVEDSLANLASVRYARTILEQSGHTITRIRVDAMNPIPTPLEKLMKNLSEKQFAEIEEATKLSRKQSVYSLFDIILDVAPLPGLRDK